MLILDNFIESTSLYDMLAYNDITYIYYTDVLMLLYILLCVEPQVNLINIHFPLCGVLKL